MTRRRLTATVEAWPLARPFVIARGVRTQADVVLVTLSDGDAVGRGEGVPIPRYGDTAESCVEAILGLRDQIEAGLDRAALLQAMKLGAARNALDCALWDLEARLSGVSVAERLGAGRPGVQATAMTVGIDTPDAMAEAARALAAFPLIKVKVNADDPAARLAAVRAAAPDPTLIVDANESWDLALLKAMQPHLAAARVALLEQPLPAGQDEALRGFSPQVALCADESCHTAADLPRLDGLYQAINIKLDKTGGLTAALDLLAAARARRLTVMTGCMICTSLSIAPLFHVAARADFADLDGPTWLAADRPGAAVVEQGMMTPPLADLWGG